MANPTTNFGWVMPTSTSLVTNLPADFNTFGQGVDTSMAQLKGGTTGQILSKTSATDMAFTWITPNPGDITGVTAGTGISGGGTSGDVTITNSMATAMTTKGDLVPATGSGTFSRLAIGTNGQVLTADSTAATGMKWNTGLASPLTTKGDLWTYSTTDARLAVGTNGQTLVADSTASTGLKWATPASGGKVLQVLMATDSSWTQSATNTFIDTGLSLSITPSSATSKVLAFVSQSGTGKANSQTWGEFILLRGATTIVTFEDRAGENGSTATNDVGTTSTVYLDSPATTSATTYKTQFRSGNNSNRAEAGVASSTSTLVLMEIGA